MIDTATLSGLRPISPIRRSPSAATQSWRSTAAIRTSPAAPRPRLPKPSPRLRRDTSFDRIVAVAHLRRRGDPHGFGQRRSPRYGHTERRHGYVRRQAPMPRSARPALAAALPQSRSTRSLPARMESLPRTATPAVNFQRAAALPGFGTPVTVAGTGNESYSDPFGVAVDAAGDVFTADSGNNCIREVNASTGVIYHRCRHPGSLAIAATADRPPPPNLDYPTGMAVDAGGNLFIADTGNGVIREGQALHGHHYHRRRQRIHRL